MVSIHDDRLERLMNSEINFSISHFYDEGLRVKVGDEMNGWVDEMVGLDTLQSAISILWQMAQKKFPEADCFKK